MYALGGMFKPKMYGYIYGLGGTDITPEIIEEIIRRTEREQEPGPESVWIEEQISPRQRQKEIAR